MTKKPRTRAAKVVRQVTPEKDLNTLLRQCRSAKGQMDEISGSLRDKIANAVEKKHLHKKAFSVTRSLDKLEPEALLEFFDHFDHYCDVGGLRKRAEDAPGLELDDESEGADKNPETGKVTRPRLVGGTGNGQPADVG